MEHQRIITAIWWLDICYALALNNNYDKNYKEIYNTNCCLDSFS
jgi:hypothetical protein